jgi:hypothetical protein
MLTYRILVDTGSIVVSRKSIAVNRVYVDRIEARTGDLIDDVARTLGRAT